MDRHGSTILRYGAWHGDWAPWNMAALADTLLVWDWERFTARRSAGLRRRPPRVAAPDRAGAGRATVALAARRRRADELLAAFEVAPAARELTALLYLVDLATRYLTDRQAEAGARLGVLGRWLLPVSDPPSGEAPEPDED